MNITHPTRVVLAGTVLAVSVLAGCYDTYTRRETVYREGAPMREEVVYVQQEPVPPPLVHETITVSPGPGYMWVPGHHEWNGGRWQWEGGHWERAPHQTAVWVPAHFERYNNGWAWKRGRWK